MRARPALLAVAFLCLAQAANGAELTVAPAPVTEWKALHGRVEARTLIPARARIGGTLVELRVSEGDDVRTGQTIAVIRDDKIAFQVAAIEAELRALEAQQERAQTELGRGQSLSERGVITAQRLDQLRTDVDVTRNQIAAIKARRDVIVQQGQEGAVLAPADGRILTVPVTRGAVVMPGEPVATLGSGGFFLRLAVPERHAAALRQGAQIRIGGEGSTVQGKLAKIYPQIDKGRVIADVEIGNLPTQFVDARVLVEVSLGTRNAITVPRAAIVTRSGLDFVRVQGEGGPVERVVVLGESFRQDGGETIEVLTGLSAGDRVLMP